jgi:hypothetical protein
LVAKPSAGEPLQRGGLRIGQRRAQLAPGIGEEAQGPRARDLGVELAQRSGGGVARVGEGLGPRLRLPAFSASKSAWLM